METNIINESGYKEAIIGIGYSYGITDIKKLERVALSLADKDGGHNKFLESMQVWINIRAPRYFWAEFDTYRAGTTKQSESTIHTLTKAEITQDDFCHVIVKETIDYLNMLINKYSTEEEPALKKLWFKAIKANLPEGYLQSRLVCTNYKVLRNIIWQRRNHRLQEWRDFIGALKEQVAYKDILFKGWEE